jgi:ketosteroid isomerase-like protein
MEASAELLTPEQARDLAERFYDAWNRGGAETVAREFWDPDIVLYDDPMLPDAGVVRGREKAIERLASFFEAFGDLKFTVLEALPFPGGALAGVRLESTGPSSGVPIEGVLYHVGRLRSGRFIEVRTYRHRDQALLAAGLTSAAPQG